MAESIEAFVSKLQEEGVQAGRQAAEKLRAEAQQQGDEIIRQAEIQAEEITADAKAQAESNLAKANTELKLAARDAVLRLRETLSRVVEGCVIVVRRDIAPRQQAYPPFKHLSVGLLIVEENVCRDV